jgi:hypothetical protein
MIPHCLYVSDTSSPRAAAKMARLHSVKTCRSCLGLADDCRSEVGKSECYIDLAGLETVDMY